MFLSAAFPSGTKTNALGVAKAVLTRRVGRGREERRRRSYALQDGTQRRRCGERRAQVVSRGGPILGHAATIAYDAMEATWYGAGG